jgi:hypothetical protein
MEKGATIMNSKTKLSVLVVTVIGLVVLMTLVSYVSAEGEDWPPPRWSPEGAWLNVIPLWDPNLGHYDDLMSITTLAAVNREGSRFTRVIHSAKPGDPTFGGAFPDAYDVTNSVGPAYMTDWNTLESAGVAYGLKRVEGNPLPQIAYIEILTSKVEFVDGDTLEGEGTVAIYLPHQDANSDGFPDEDETPIVCIPYTVTSRRIQPTLPCEVASEPPGE